MRAFRKICALPSRGRRLHADERGMSILEMLVVVLIGSLVVYAGLETFVTMNHQTIWQDQVTDAQQSARAVQRVLSEHLRMAGFGIPLILYPVLGTDANPDTITITHQTPDGCEAFLSASMADPSDNVTCDGEDLSCFSEGQWVFIHDATVDSGEFFQIGAIQSAPDALVPATGLERAYPNGAAVYNIAQYTFYVDNSDTAHPNLMVQEYGGNAEVYAENIEDLRFAYIMQSGDTVQTPTQPYLVTNVLVSLVARTSRIDEDIAQDYRRRPLDFNVSIRNLEF
ncbi:MAG: hypothetical protein AB1752_04630 [Candidatus Zixiibacteriota bacterium]